MTLVTDRAFYRRLLLIALPVALQNTITLLVNLADSVMVGQLGEAAISGVYAGNQVQVMLQMLIMGIGTGMTILSAQYWGKGDRNSVAALVGIALQAAVGIGLALLAVMLFLPERVLGLFTKDPAVLAEGMRYARVIRYTYVFFAMTQILVTAFRSVSSVRIGLVLSLMTLGVNVTLNWVLIFGHLGFPALGVEGAAIATLAARMLETALMVAYTLLVDRKLHLRLRDMWRASRALLRDYIHYGLPVFVGDIQWGLNLVIQAAIIGALGTIATSAVTIANALFSIVSVVVYALANATAVVIGQTVGAGETELVKQYAKTLQWIFLGLGIVMGAVLFALKDAILLLYSVEPATKDMARQFMIVLSVMLVGTSYQMSVLTGIVRAGGATHFVLRNDMIFVWGVVLPSAALSAFVFHAPAWVVFACLKCDQILKCFVAVVKVNRFDWIQKLTREDDEGAAEPAKIEAG